MHVLKGGNLQSHRAAAGKDEGKGHRRQKPKRIYSNLTAKDHAWYLAKQGKPCWPLLMLLSPW